MRRKGKQKEKKDFSLRQDKKKGVNKESLMGKATEETGLTDDLKVSSRNEEDDPVVDGFPPVLGLLIDDGKGVAFGEGKLLGGRPFVRVKGLGLDNCKESGYEEVQQTE